MYKYINNLLFFIFILNTESYNINRRTLMNNLVTGISNSYIITHKELNNSYLLENEDMDLKINYKNQLEKQSIEEIGIIQDIDNDIYFYAPVTQRTCFELKNKLNLLEFKSNIFVSQYKMSPPPINLHIQSEGGSLYHALYIIDLIRELNTPVHTYIDGFAASAATLISVVGTKRYMTENSLMLIHQLSGSESGKYYELEDQMNNMDILMNIIRKIYLNYSTITPNYLEYLLQKDLWLESKTCLEYGLVDEII